MSLRTIVAILFLGGLPFPMYADEPKYKPIDAETIAAYKKLGAEYGWFCVVDGHSVFSSGEDAAAKGLPGFRFGVSEGKLPKLPPVKVPFGLDLVLTEVSDAGLKELKNLDNLTVLHLRGTILTSVKAQALQTQALEDLKKLRSLRRDGKEVTDADWKKMEAALKTLNEERARLSENSKLVYLYGTNVTDAGLEELRNLKTLTELDLRFTAVTDEGAQELQEALPKCQIVR